MQFHDWLRVLFMSHILARKQFLRPQYMNQIHGHIFVEKDSPCQAWLETEGAVLGERHREGYMENCLRPSGSVHAVLRRVSASISTSKVPLRNIRVPQPNARIAQLPALRRRRPLLQTRAINYAPQALTCLSAVAKAQDAAREAAELRLCTFQPKFWGRELACPQHGVRRLRLPCRKEASGGPSEHQVHLQQRTFAVKAKSILQLFIIPLMQLSMQTILSAPAWAGRS